MAVYRRGKTWWYSFVKGRRVQESSGFTNKTAALRVEAKRKADLLDRRAGFTKAKLAPKFEEFADQFLKWSAQVHRPKTHQLHDNNSKCLKRFSMASGLTKSRSAWSRTSRSRGFRKIGGERRAIEEEVAYLAKASQPLRDIARIILDTGMRPREVFRI